MRPVPKELVAGLIAVLGFAAVFRAPYLFPPSDGLSVSYAHGFSNRACEAILLLFITLFAWAYRGFGLTPPTENLEPTANPSCKWLAITSALSLVGCVAVWARTRDNVGPAEASYFLDRLEMYQRGGSLYHGFEFDYGPLLFLPAVWLATLLNLPLGDGYYLFWTTQWVLGVAALWLLVRHLPAKPAVRTPVFLLFWGLLMLSIVDCGANYTPLRFVATPLLAIAVYRLYQSGTRMVVVFAVAASGIAFLLLYSPEQAAVFVAGTLIFFLLCVSGRRPGTFALLSGLAGWGALLAAVADRFGVLDTMKKVGNDPISFPLLPSFAICALLVLLVAAACLVRNALAQRSNHALFLYAASLSLVSFPAAFGRCDAGHIYVNLLCLYLVAVLALFPSAPRLAWGSGALFGLFLLGQLAGHTMPLLRMIGQTRVIAAERQYPAHGRMLADEARLFAPFGTYHRATRIPGPQVITGFYPWFHTKTSADMAAKKIEEIERWDLPLLAPERAALSPEGGACDATATELGQTVQGVLRPWLAPRVKHVPQTGRPLCDYILKHYRIDEEIAPVRGMVVWIRVR